MADDTLSAALTRIRGLVADRDALVDQMRTRIVWVGELNAAQDRLAGEVPALLAAIEAALELHKPVDRGRVIPCCRGCEEANGEFHEDCCHEHPCPTYEAILAALTGKARDGS